MVEHLPDGTKAELAEALAAVRKAAAHWQKCLLVQIEGIGRFDATACRLAARRYEQTVAAAAAITDETIPSLALFDERETAA